MSWQSRQSLVDIGELEVVHFEIPNEVTRTTMPSTTTGPLSPPQGEPTVSREQCRNNRKILMYYIKSIAAGFVGFGT